jgi:uncharacterized BrkB/YihY/UPF0761 family membrane protein
MKAFFLVFSVLVGLVIFFMYVHSVPRQLTLTHQVLAGVVILLVVFWFTAEMVRGGGDPNK